MTPDAFDESPFARGLEWSWQCAAESAKLVDATPSCTTTEGFSQHMSPSNPSEYLRALFDSLPVAVLLANDDARYVDANVAACELFGRKRSELIGVHVSDVIAPGRMAEVDIQWKAFVRDGEQSGEFEIALPDGASRTVHFHARANFAPGLHCSFMSVAPKPVVHASDDGSLLTMCAWTKQVRIGDEWISIEHYLADHHSMRISHGVAPDAFQRLMRDARES